MKVGGRLGVSARAEGNEATEVGVDSPGERGEERGERAGAEAKGQEVAETALRGNGGDAGQAEQEAEQQPPGSRAPASVGRVLVASEGSNQER